MPTLVRLARTRTVTGRSHCQRHRRLRLCRVRWSVLALACSVAGCLCVLATPPAPAVADAAVSPIGIYGVAGGQARRTMRLVAVTGACITRVDVARLVQRRTRVQIQLTETTPMSDLPCPSVGVFRCVEVVLAEPLGKRPITDLTSGATFRSAAKRTPQSPNADRFKNCRPPGPVPPWHAPR